MNNFIQFNVFTNLSISKNDIPNFNVSYYVFSSTSTFIFYFVIDIKSSANLKHWL